MYWKVSPFKQWGMVLCLLCLSWGASGVAAESGEGPRFHVYTQGSTKADVDDGGSYSRTRTAVSVGYKQFTLSYVRSDYNWSDTGSVALGRAGGRTPWEHLHRVALDGRFQGFLTDRIGWFAGATLVSGFEEELSDSFSAVGRGGLSFALHPEFNVRVGALGIASPVHPILVPLLELDWRTPEDYGFSAEFGLPSGSVRYRFNDAVAARVSGYWNRALHRLSDDSPVARKGYVEESNITTGAYLDMTPLAGLTLTLGAEVEAWRVLRIYDEHGDKLSRTQVDPSLGGVLRIGYNF